MSESEWASGSCSEGWASKRLTMTMATMMPSTRPAAAYQSSSLVGLRKQDIYHGHRVRSLSTTKLVSIH